MKTPNVKDSFKQLNGTRFGAKTPKFFRYIRNLGLLASGIGVFIATAPISLPVAIISAGKIMAWIGGTSAMISQFAKE